MVLSELAAEAIADTFHVDVVSIYPSPTRAQGAMATNFTTAYDEGTARCVNECAHIEPMVGRRSEEQGGADVTVGEISVKVAPGIAGSSRPGDHVVVEESADPALEGVTLIVNRLEPRTSALTRRLICRRPEARSGPGAP